MVNAYTMNAKNTVCEFILLCTQYVKCILRTQTIQVSRTLTFWSFFAPALYSLYTPANRRERQYCYAIYLPHSSWPSVWGLRIKRKHWRRLLRPIAMALVLTALWRRGVWMLLTFFQNNKKNTCWNCRNCFVTSWMIQYYMMFVLAPTWEPCKHIHTRTEITDRVVYILKSTVISRKFTRSSRTRTLNSLVCLCNFLIAFGCYIFEGAHKSGAAASAVLSEG